VDALFTACCVITLKGEEDDAVAGALDGDGVAGAANKCVLQ
jgi:hypothetical protein